MQTQLRSVMSKLDSASITRNSKRSVYAMGILCVAIHTDHMLYFLSAGDSRAMLVTSSAPLRVRTEDHLCSYSSLYRAWDLPEVPGAN